MQVMAEMDQTLRRKMRLPIAAILSVAGILAACPALAATYTNGRYGYQVSYPENLLIPEREADAGDGLAFHARRRPAKMSVWAAWNLDDEAVDQSPQGVAREAASDCAGRAAYRLVKPNLVALSCETAKGTVIYQKTIISKAELTTVRFGYPGMEKAIWNDVVARVAGSLKQGRPDQ
jgi:hypothetical protein